ncbi:uncharacterized protein M421DRAFT_397808 [Didymella exigua CBS 183.55]|uniref:Uncharacterized protein n=1 Tax=Didymella exigua CBS 183.55 TaxID=1150837 RepID=A0A6A5RET5_9PLEO|nr:uncharacterized protein M421DRAFT_397808 [Didymella exigua CBS 183.55]KAF1926013.1 hypothetical protein M421DRAFT_397808 [Didymella exigua CBS 183.55]
MQADCTGLLSSKDERQNQESPVLSVADVDSDHQNSDFELLPMKVQANDEDSDSTTLRGLRFLTTPSRALLLLRHWGWELGALLFSLIGFFGTVGTLKAFDGKSQPAWPYANINRGLACFGALLTVLAFGVGPTLQQAIVMDTRSISMKDLATIPWSRAYLCLPSIPGWYTSIGNDVIPADMAGSLYTGIHYGSMLPRQASLDLVPNFPTTDCDYPQFESLAVCSACQNQTQKVEKSCFTKTSLSPPPWFAPNIQTTQCNFSLENGLQLNKSGCIRDMTGKKRFQDESYLRLDTMTISAMLDPLEPVSNASIANVTMLNASVSNDSISADATHRSLYWCVNEYKASVIDGELVEHQISSDGEWLSVFERATYWVQRPATQGNETGYSYWIDPESSSRIYYWLYPLFIASDSESLQFIEKAIDWEGGGGKYEDDVRWDPDSSSNFSFGGPPVPHLRDLLSSIRNVGPEAVFANLAKSLTTYIRTDGATNHTDDYSWPIDPVVGTAYLNEVYVRVRWLWLIFMGIMLIGTIVFFILTVYESFRQNVEAWKSEPLALMYHGVDRTEKEQCLDSVEDMHEQSKEIRVCLQETGSGLRLE